MAKPGSGRAREIANGRAIDLRVAAMSDKQAQTVQEGIELTRGTRCFRCGRRIGAGFRFTSLDPRDSTDPIMQLAACARDDCDGSELARQGATYVEPLEIAWLDPNGLDAPACKVRVQRTSEEPAEPAEQPAKDPPSD